jgi:hypothetical protein
MAASRARLRLLKTSDFSPEGTEALYKLFNDSILHGGTIGFLKPMSRKRAQEYFRRPQARHPHTGDVIAVVSGTRVLDGFGLIRRDEESCSGTASRWAASWCAATASGTAWAAAIVPALAGRSEAPQGRNPVARRPHHEMSQRSNCSRNMGFRTLGHLPGSDQDWPRVLGRALHGL